MLINDENINALIQRIYDAALDDMLWIPVISELARFIHAMDSQLFSPRVAINVQPFLLSPSASADSNYWRYYDTYYWQHDVWAIRAKERGLLQKGVIVHGDQLIERCAFRQTEMHCDFLKPLQGGVEAFMGTVLFDGSAPEQSPPIFLSFYKTAFAEAFTPQDERLVRYLMPHLQRALGIRRKMAEQQHMRQLHEQALQQVAAAVMLLDATGRLLFANRKAELLLRCGCNPTGINDRLVKQAGLTVNNGLLCGTNETVNQALAKVLALAEQGIGHSFVIIRPPNLPLKIDSVPIADNAATVLLPESQAGKVLLLLSNESDAQTDTYGTFAKTYRLTPQETKVLQGIIEGYCLKEIAGRHAVSFNTVRSQLASVMQKTYCKRQKDLVRLFSAG